MKSVCGLRLDANIVVRLVAENNFYLRLTNEKIHTFAVFNNKYSQPQDFSDTSLTATVNCTNEKFEIVNEIIEIQIIGIQIDFLFLW